MRRTTPHPDFIAAPARRQWRGRSLRELWATMTRWAEHAAQTMDGGHLPIWYVLEGGALVALDYDGQGRRVLRIARSSAPADGGAAFRRECETFLAHFGCTHWTPEPDPDASGIAMLYREGAELFNACARCSRPLDVAAQLHGDGETCTTCVSAARREEVTS
jgi:YD repeat-containing protein